ncbi:hypothetical protein QBC35DRAFT_506662 [Podospora australis]|uniref:Uncharacterized protein n=1 Tax=Podospora australis TaxID=1536484 RepID=A0AAN6WLH2_9PEZI|nr:hypothetical protein QBC35DRAFT_506662 [Podospora australis]
MIFRQNPLWWLFLLVLQIITLSPLAVQAKPCKSCQDCPADQICNSWSLHKNMPAVANLCVEREDPLCYDPRSRCDSGCKKEEKKEEGKA